MAKQKDFNTFLTNIEPSTTTVSYISSVQNSLRDYLEKHSTYKAVCVQTFLSGSYAKHTSIRPKLYDGKRDVDIVVETIYESNDSSINVLNELFNVLKEKSVYENAKLQKHSVGIEMQGIDIDVVPVIRSEDGTIYCIGSSDTDEWILTDPKGHIEWSSETNSDNEQKYKPLVKMMKWWRRTNCPDDKKYPKGLTLEKIIADNLPDSHLSTENHLVATINNILSAYKDDVANGIMPNVKDPCLEENDLLFGYMFSDFKAFILLLEEHKSLIEQDGMTNDTWRVVFGKEFPKDEQKTVASIQENSANNEQFIEDVFPVRIEYKLKLDCNVTQDGWRPFSLRRFLSGGGYLRHNKNLDFHISECSVPTPYSIYWKVRNVGEIAEKRNQIRGQITKTDNDHQREHTNFYGPHFVECYIIKNGVCVARDRIDVPIGVN